VLPLLKLLEMNPRSEDLLGMRPLIAQARVSPEMSAEERFQNTTLRPIIKFQNDLLLAAFRNYIRKHKNGFYELSMENRLSFVENAIQKDIKFRNSLKGMVIGQYTLEEYELYIANSSALNKRMMNMVIERIKDQIQIFTAPALV